MSLKGQYSQNYNEADEVQNLHDIRKVLSLSGEKARGYEQRVIDILSRKTEQDRQKTLIQLRNSLFNAMSGALPDSGYYAGIGFLDGLNQNHQKEYNFYNFLSTNPKSRGQFLTVLDNAIDLLLKNEGGADTTLNVAQKMESLTEDNFDTTRTQIEDQAGHTGVVYFLEECIRTGKYLEKVKKYIDSKYSEEQFGTGNIKAIDFSNLRSQLVFRGKLDIQDDAMKKGKSFSLSGGVSNALAELGYIREFYRNGGVIRSITGTSMGAIVAVMISKVVGEKKGTAAVDAINQLIGLLSKELQGQIDTANAKLKNQKHSLRQKSLHAFIIGKIPLPTSLTALKKNNTKELEETFKNVAHSLGITDGAKFSELDIPVLINASHQYGHKGEKEVIISGDMSIVEALTVTANMPGTGSTNIGMFGDRKLLGLSLVDYAANEQGNMVSHLTDAGIQPQDIIALDVGYSSNAYNHYMAQVSRLIFPRARFRDFGMKNYLKMYGGRVDDLDTENSGNNGGEEFSPQTLKNLVDIGAQKYISTSPPPQ